MSAPTEIWSVRCTSAATRMSSPNVVGPVSCRQGAPDPVPLWGKRGSLDEMTWSVVGGVDS